MHVDTNTQATPLFRYERLLTSRLLDTRRERDNSEKSFVSYYANETPNCQAGPQLLNTMVENQLLSRLPQRQTTQLSVYMAQSQLSNCLFFKIFKFSGPLLPDMTSFTLQPHFLSGVYYDNCDCHILCIRA